MSKSEYKNLPPNPNYLFPKEWFEVTQLGPRLWAVGEPGHFEDVLCFVLMRPQGIILIDTGMGFARLRELLPPNAPVEVLLTHSDSDHMGSAGEFDEVSILNHPYAKKRLKKGWTAAEIGLSVDDFTGRAPDARALAKFKIPAYPGAKFFKDGQVLKLFDMEIEVIHTPGHTPDSVCFLTSEGDLFTGDTLYPGPEYLHMPDSDPEMYLQSLIKLQRAVKGRAKRILPGHNQPAVGIELLDNHILALQGKLKPLSVVYDQDQFGPYVEKKFSNFALRLPYSKPEGKVLNWLKKLF